MGGWTAGGQGVAPGQAARDEEVVVMEEGTWTYQMGGCRCRATDHAGEGIAHHKTSCKMRYPWDQPSLREVRHALIRTNDADDDVRNRYPPLAEPTGVSRISRFEGETAEWFRLRGAVRA